MSRVVQEAFDGDTPDQPDPSSCTRMSLQSDKFVLFIAIRDFPVTINRGFLVCWSENETTQKNTISVMQARLVYCDVQYNGQL